MALTHTLDAGGAGSFPAYGLGQTLKFKTGTISLDASYPTGGYALDLAQFFSTLLGAMFETKAGYLLEYDYTNAKVKAMRFDYPAVAVGAAIEVAAAVNLSAVTNIRYVAWGF